MVSTFSPNIQLEEPARGDQVGVWDTPVNANMTLLDLIAGNVTTISGAAGSVTLAAAQFQSKTITFNSTLLASITVTFPTSFKKSYEIQNLCTGSSAFTITLQTTASASGGQYICCPPGEIVDVVNDGTNIKFKNLGRVGEYMTIAGSSMPNWISGCAVPPYVNCDGTSFSSAQYPQLAIRLGGTTLPDARGRTLYALDQGVNRVSSATCSVPGNTLLGAGGDQAAQAHNHQVFITDPGHFHAQDPQTFYNGTPVQGIQGSGGSAMTLAVHNTASAVTGMTIGSAAGLSNNQTAVSFGGNSQNMPPVLVAGLTLIRAA